MKPLEIAVAGAGPAGLSAALSLNRLGHRVHLFDRFVEARPVGSGLMLQTTGLAVLNDLGLGTGIRALGAPIRRLYGRRVPSGKIVLDVGFPDEASEALAVHRAALFNLLFSAVEREGIAIETSVEIADIQHGADDRPSLVDMAGRYYGPFDLVVDALGARSPLLAHAGIPIRRRMLAYGALWASLDLDAGDGFAQDALEQRYRAASIMAGVLPVGRIVPGGANLMTFFWSLKPEKHADWLRAGLAKWKDQAADLWPAIAPVLARLTDPGQLTLAAYGHHTLPLPFGRRLVFVGDSAHSTSPQLGQGANMALLDTTALGLALAQEIDIQTALQTYARLRRFHVRSYQLISALFTPFYQSDSRLLPFLRDHLWSAIAALPGARALLTRLVSGQLLDPIGKLGLDSRRRE